MSPSTGATTLLPILGLILSGVLAASSIWVLWWARRSAALLSDHLVRIPWPGGGVVVGTPTVLVIGLSLGLCSYHAAAFALRALQSSFLLPTPLALGSSWVLVVGCGVAVGLSLATDRVEQRGLVVDEATDRGEPAGGEGPSPASQPRNTESL